MSTCEQKREKRRKRRYHTHSHTLQETKCPSCGSTALWCDGTRTVDGKEVQRYRCRSCGSRFSDPMATAIFRDIKNTISEECTLLQPVEIKTGDTSDAQTEAYSQKINECRLYMQKKGLAEATVKSRIKLIKRLISLGANLYDDESIKAIIAKMKWSNGFKNNFCDAYGTFVEMLGGTWKKPKYQEVESEIFVPLPREVEAFIASCSPMMSTFLMLLSETAMRPGEALHLNWKDFDPVTRTVRITPEKGSRAGTAKISEKLTAKIEDLPRKHTTIFCKPDTTLEHFSANYRKQRRRATHKLKNERLMQITLKTFRHYRATLEANRTKDPFAVQRILRHRNILNTMKYIHLAQVLFKDDQKYVSKVAFNAKEACGLVDAGFEYVTGEYADGGKIFRKPKDFVED